ncbi:substrate-binding domain-containing protein [Mitsuaria sp. GD03876]|uniref:molybdate ABC transporter substrate-binding protein n=1 Tax=Mitsuaria sp. GD03876 TaxID=2975399 RepID=UPI00244CBEDE|nr:substrate-binding domain-containing protein [Mitsuaria sp. GD03876]MDH0866168.1 substrate-binding domain-containing protein [Mitsuaria sp. GD03876]
MRSKPSLRRRLVVAAALIGALGVVPSARAADRIVAVSSGGFAEAFKTLAARYEKDASAVTVDRQFGPSMGETPQAIPARLARGEALDVVIMVGPALDKLIAQGLVDGATKVVLADSYIACAVPAGEPAPDLDTVEQVKAAFLNAPSVAWSDSASGEYIQHVLLKRLGIESQVKAKGRQIPATPVGEIVASRQAAFGCQQRSELQPVEGIRIVGELPSEIQKVTPYAAGVVTSTRYPVQAAAFIRYLASTGSADALRQSGLHPTAR